MIDNDFTTENGMEEVLIEAQERQISIGESEESIVTESPTSLISTVEETSTFNIAVGEVSGVSLGTRVVVNHNASDPNQHTISAITGLREELDKIQALKTVYSDKSNIANYYKWKDIPYEHGRFVSLTSGDSTIEICSGSDIFGVSVENAGFVGRQDATVPRDKSYGLIVTSGLVDVQCESSVKVGDYVVSNDRGYAKKSDSDYGYKVLAIENKDGIEYAVIMLGVQADVTNDLGLQLGEIERRVDVNETNIVSAVNVANQAYNKATEIGVSNQEMSDKVDGALGVVDKVTSDVENLETQVSNSALISAQAKAIAESAATSAESMKNEAVAEANKALAETSELRKEFEEKIVEIDTELDNTTLELQATKEDIFETKEELQQSIEDTKADIDIVNNEIKNDITNTKADLNEAKEDILSLQEDLIPLVSWPEGSESPTGIAGFVAKADENSITIGDLVKWQGETDESIAAFKQEVSDNYATQVMLSEVGDNLALFQQEVSDTYATQEMVSAVDDSLTEYKQEVTDTYATQEMVSSVDDALTSYKQEVSKNYATQQMLSSVEDSITSYKQEVTDTYATQEMVTTVSDNLASFKQEVKDDYATQEMVTGVDNALTSYKQEVEKNYATQQMLSTVEDNLASFQQEVKDDYATQEMVTTVGDNLTSYKQEVEKNYATQEMVTKLETDTSKALADYKQEVEDEYATQEMVTKLETDTSEALADYKQEVSDTYATNTSLATLKTETTDAITASEEKATETYASKSDFTSFESKTNTAMTRIEQKADANGAYIQSTVANMDKYAVGPYSQAYGFTLEQAASVLEEGMIYVPTIDKIGDNAEVYNYTGSDGKPQKYTRTFLRGYLYQWGKRPNGLYGWITVDKNYSSDITEESADPTKTINTSAMAVYFSITEIAVSDSNNYGYWYTDGDTVTEGYEPYTLYKWDLPYKYESEDGKDIEEYHWVAVATLAGNSQNRAISQIKQTTNSIEVRVTGVEGQYTGIKTQLDKDSAKVNSVAAWPSDVGTDKYNMAILKQHSDGNSAHLALAAIRNVSTSDTPSYELDELGGATIVLSDDKDGSFIQMNADAIDFTAGAFTIDADHIIFSGQKLNIKVDSTNIDGNLTIGQLDNDTASKINNSATNVYTRYGVSFNINVESIEWKEDFSTALDCYLDEKSLAEVYLWSQEVTELSSGDILYSDPTYETASSMMASWCDTNNKTLINGGHIATSTVTASQLSADAVKSNNYPIGIDGKPIIPETEPPYSSSGTFLSLENGAIYSPHFTIKPDGSAYFDGQLSADAVKSGIVEAEDLSAFGATIGGWEITGFGINTKVDNKFSVSLYSPTTDDPEEDESAVLEVQVFDGGWTTPFILKADGSLTCTKTNIAGGSIGGWEINELGLCKTVPGNFQVYMSCPTTNDPDDSDSEVIVISEYNNGWTSPFVLKADGSIVMNGNTSLESINMGVKMGIITSSIQSNTEVLMNGKFRSYGVFFTAYDNTSDITSYNYLQHQTTLGDDGYRAYLYGGGSWIFEDMENRSDAKFKHDIEVLNDKYDVFFDCITPRRFKYNDGTSDRYHLGYITGEIQESLRLANVSEQEFAGICTWGKDTNEEFGTLRYHEFISLNTWQIQKLKQRVTELEEQISSLTNKND